MVNASALKRPGLHCRDCLRTTVNVALVMQYILILSRVGMAQRCGVIEYHRLADGSWDRLVIEDVLSDIWDFHFNCILN